VGASFCFKIKNAILYSIEIKFIFKKIIMEKEISKKENSKVLAILSYFWVLCLLPFVLNIKDEFVIKHAKQGLVLFIAEIALYAIAIIPVLGWFISTIGSILAVVVAVIGIMKAASGQEWEIPYIGKYGKKINL
jgi:uncharacterized membrane protein